MSALATNTNLSTIHLGAGIDYTKAEIILETLEKNPHLPISMFSEYAFNGLIDTDFMERFKAIAITRSFEAVRMTESQ